MTQRLFVYGTLGPGRPNEHVLTEIGGTWEEASVNGRLIEQGWGAQMGYPGIVLDADGNEIKGYLFCSNRLDAHWPELDDFEGEEYERVTIQAKTANGEQVEAQIYQLKDGSDQN